MIKQAPKPYQPINAGDLDQRVTFQRGIVSREAAFGGLSVTWTDIDLGDGGSATRWASVHPTGSSEKIVADKPQAVAEYEVRVRYDSLTSVVLAKDRMIWRSKTLEIVGPPQVVAGRLEQILIHAREVL